MSDVPIPNSKDLMKMKTVAHIVGIACVVALIGIGCKPSESSSAAPSSAPEEVVAEEVDIEEMIVETTETAKKVINDANTQVQELISKAQKLVTEKKYEEAAGFIKQLSELELTPEQQKLVDNLKASIQKAMKADAVNEGAKALGNMLGGDKK